MSEQGSRPSFTGHNKVHNGDDNGINSSHNRPRRISRPNFQDLFYFEFSETGDSSKPFIIEFLSFRTDVGRIMFRQYRGKILGHTVDEKE